MRVELLVPDQAREPLRATSSGAFARALDAVSATLDAAQRAENAYAQDRGSLQAAVIDRARADVVLSIAIATAQRSAQAIQSILNMQI